LIVSASIMQGPNGMQPPVNTIKLENPGYYCNSYTPPAPEHSSMMTSGAYSKYTVGPALYWVLTSWQSLAVWCVSCEFLVLRSGLVWRDSEYRSFVTFPAEFWCAYEEILLAKGWTVWGSNPGGAIFSDSIQTGPEAHLDSYTMGSGSFPAVKRPGGGANLPPPSSTEVKEEQN